MHRTARVLVLAFVVLQVNAACTPAVEPDTLACADCTEVHESCIDTCAVSRTEDCADVCTDDAVISCLGACTFFVTGSAPHATCLSSCNSISAACEAACGIDLTCAVETCQDDVYFGCTGGCESFVTGSQEKADCIASCADVEAGCFNSCPVDPCDGDCDGSLDSCVELLTCE